MSISNPRVMYDGTLAYPERGNPPPDRPNYVRDPGNPYHFIPMINWLPCKYRDTRSVPCNCPNGTKNVYHTCSIGIPIINAKTCSDCTQRIEPDSLTIMRVMWRELYLARQINLDEFTARIPCPECRDHWILMLQENPAPQSVGGVEWREWVCDRHNQVNQLLGKPTFTYLQAALANL